MIDETDDAPIRQGGLPGVPQDAASVELHEYTRGLSGKRTRQGFILGGQYQRGEGHYGAFQRAIRMPTVVDKAMIQAIYQDGVLALPLPEHIAATP
jgi:HSP20 family protein